MVMVGYFLFKLQPLTCQAIKSFVDPTSSVLIQYTVEPQWLENLCSHENMFEIEVIHANDC